MYQPQPLSPPPAANDNAVPRLERRSARRDRVLLGGKLVYLSGGYTQDCSVRNLSAEGASIRLMGDEPATPGDLNLILISRGFAYRARSVWTEGSDAGLLFMDGCSLTGPVPPAFDHAKGLWAELGPR